MIDDRKEESLKDIQRLYKDRKAIHETLQDLDRRWRLGENMLDRIDAAMHRNRSLIVFLNYLLFSTTRRIRFLEWLDLLGTEEAKFLDELVDTYEALEQPIRGVSYNMRGVLNHLSSIRPEGAYYDTTNQIILVQFSVHTEGGRLMQIRNNLDDVIWLSSEILEISWKVLEESKSNKIKISKTHVDTLRGRIDELGTNFEEVKKQLAMLSSPEDAENNEAISSDSLSEREHDTEAGSKSVLRFDSSE